MDKETLIRLATPASIALLALSIISHPILVKSEVSGIWNGEPRYPIHIKCVGGC